MWMKIFTQNNINIKNMSSTLGLSNDVKYKI